MTPIWGPKLKKKCAAFDMCKGRQMDRRTDRHMKKEAQAGKYGV